MATERNEKDTGGLENTMPPPPPPLLLLLRLDAALSTTLID